MKVLLADDHWIVRDSLKHAMRSVGPDVEVLEASDFEGALELLRRNPDTALMLIDLVMPGFTEFHGLKMLRSFYPDVPIVVVSIHEERDYIIRAIEEGVIGYIPKSAEGPEVLRALNLVMNGEVSFPRHILQSADRAVTNGADGPAMPAAPDAILTPREAEVHRLANGGHSNAQIAAELGLSPNTVRVHLRNIALKIGKDDPSRSGAATARSRLP